MTTILDVATNALIAIDQFVNVFVWAKADRRFGKPDETLSARAWRLRNTSKRWAFFKDFVDGLFFRTKDDNGKRCHCRDSYVSELCRIQLPTEYRDQLKRDYTGQ